MRRRTQFTSGSARSMPRASRLLMLVVSLCGALAGGSIVEAIAAMASHATFPVAPDHLIAEPLVIAGAICGGLLSAILASTEHRESGNLSAPRTPICAPVEVTPAEPMVWQPAPQVLSDALVGSAKSAVPGESAYRALRLRRTVRQHRHSHRAARADLFTPPPPR